MQQVLVDVKNRVDLRDVQTSHHESRVDYEERGEQNDFLLIVGHGEVGRQEGEPEEERGQNEKEDVSRLVEVVRQATRLHGVDTATKYVTVT